MILSETPTAFYAHHTQINKITPLLQVFLTWKRVGCAVLGSTQNQTGSWLVSDKISRLGFHIISHQSATHDHTNWGIGDRFPARETDLFPTAPKLALGPWGLRPQQ
jgi:hypothetical protein